MKNIYKKLFELQTEVGKISKDKENPFFKSSYFDINQLIEHLKPLLKKHGLLVLQPLTSSSDNKSCLTTIVVDTESGEDIKYYTPLPEVTDVQKLGGAITYMRRYALQSLFFLESEDDDGNKASGKKALQDNNDVPF